MKSTKEIILKSIAKEAKRTAKREADAICFCFGYQPVMPQKVKDLRKKK